MEPVKSNFGVSSPFRQASVDVGGQTLFEPGQNQPMKGMGLDNRTDEFLYNAAKKTTRDKNGVLSGPLAGFADSRSKYYLEVFGPGGILSDDQRPEEKNPTLAAQLSRALFPGQSKEPGASPYDLTPRYENAIGLYRSLRGK